MPLPMFVKYSHTIIVFVTNQGCKKMYDHNPPSKLLITVHNAGGGMRIVMPNRSK